MPPPSSTSHPPSVHLPSKQRPRSPNRVLAETEAQWLFTDAELANTPSIQDGMKQDEERELRAKGVNFIVQVGIMLKLPQLTLSTASIFFQRFLMRASLKKSRDDIPKLHHYQIAATAVFLATKVEESGRKMKDMIIAFCRVAQKNPNLVIDEQSKDWWRWRDCILHNEDVLLETLCFDLTVESPHRQLFDMLKYYSVEHNKRLRNVAWAFVTDSNNTQLCLLCSSRAIAVASLYAACKYCDVSLPDDSKARPWWETQHVRLKEIRRAVEYMLQNYDQSANKINGIATSSGSDGNGSIYVGLSTPGVDGNADGWDSTRVRDDIPGSASPFQPPGSERRLSNASSIGMKRDREDHEPTSGGGATNGGPHEKRQRIDQRNERNGTALATTLSEAPATAPMGDDLADMREREEIQRVQDGNRESGPNAKTEANVDASVPTRPLDSHDEPTQPPDSHDELAAEVTSADEGEVSEEGEVA